MHKNQRRPDKAKYHHRNRNRGYWQGRAFDQNLFWHKNRLREKRHIREETSEMLASRYNHYTRYNCH